MTGDADTSTISLDGAVALVTGGTRGIGRAIAGRLLKAGATVVICGRNRPEKVPEAGERRADFMACNVREPDACAALITAIAEQHGRLDLLVNNAGGSPASDVATASPRFSKAIVELNLLGPIYLSQAAHRIMSQQDSGGAIINIASVSGTRPSPGTAVYGAAKAGLINLTASLAQEWGPKTRVNAIIAGLVETEDALATYGSREAMDAIAEATPMKRMVRASDIADAALLLASPLAKFITGAALAVHGGGEQAHFLDLVRRHAPDDGP